MESPEREMPGEGEPFAPEEGGVPELSEERLEVFEGEDQAAAGGEESSLLGEAPAAENQAHENQTHENQTADRRKICVFRQGLPLSRKLPIQKKIFLRLQNMEIPP